MLRNHEVVDNYELLGRIGGGAFGEVYKAVHTSNQTIVAIKRIFVRCPEKGVPDNVLREVKSLQLIQHANVVQLSHVFFQGSGLLLVMEHCETDLAAVLRMRCTPLPLPIIKRIMLDVLHGVHACHSTGIMHRDLKPSNVLLTKDGIAKIADFGLARPFKEEWRCAARYTHTVATRWYRAPELLYGSRTYTPAVDCWALGCILAEMMGGAPLLAAGSDIEQLACVIELFGTINETVWPGVSSLPDFNKIQFPDCEAKSLELRLPHHTPAHALALDLVASLLRLVPEERSTAQQALMHPFFFSDPLPARDARDVFGEKD